MLHPMYKGVVLKQFTHRDSEDKVIDRFDLTKALLFNDDLVQQMSQSILTDSSPEHEIDYALVDDAQRLILAEISKDNTFGSVSEVRGKSEIEKEWIKYHQVRVPFQAKNFDVLAWWKNHVGELPLLAQLGHLGMALFVY